MFTFLTHPEAGRLVFGDKGRPELGTGVLERVMREMNRRTDVEVRWSVPGVRAILMVKLQRKYAHGRGHRTRWLTKPRQCGSVSWLEAGVNTSPRYRKLRVWAVAPFVFRPPRKKVFPSPSYCRTARGFTCRLSVS